MKHTHLLVFIILLITLPLSVFSQQEIVSPDTLAQRLRTQTSLFPQEKLHLHTDKSVYLPGETIWFRAYLVDAITHEYKAKSRYIYTELLNANDSVINRIKIRPDSLGLHYGHLLLDTKLAGGSYMLRAYSDYMRNIDDSYLFTQRITIAAATSLDAAPNLANDTTDIALSFYPEGGQLVAGQLCRTGFKAIKSDGASANIKAALLNELGDSLCSFQSTHQGMGLFSFIPESGKEYKVSYHGDDEVMYTANLPTVKPQSMALKVTQNKDAFCISVLHDKPQTTENYRLIILQRGYPLFSSAYSLTQPFIIFPFDYFDQGTIHFLLCNAQGAILSERLAFVKHPKQTTATINMDKESYLPKQKVNLEIGLTDKAEIPLYANGSITVVEAHDFLLDSTSTILSNLLLKSDISGTITDANYYFRHSTPEQQRIANYNLDLLMLIQGWRRYDIASVLQGKPHYPTIPIEESMQLKGRITTALRGKGIKQANVMVSSIGGSFIDQVKTADDGHFTITNFEQKDSIRYMLTALSPSGRDNVVITMNNPFPPVFTPTKKSFFRKSDDLEITEKYITESLYFLKLASNANEINLDEITITARAPKIKKSIYEDFASKVIRENKIKQSGAQSLKDLISFLVGSHYIHPLYGSSGALLLNDIEIEKNNVDKILKYFSILDIGQIDIIKSPMTNGFISMKQLIVAVTTKKGEGATPFQVTNTAYITPLGYQKAIEFYAPQYDKKTTNPENKLDLRTTLFWKPDIIINNGKASVNFYTADPKSNYTIVLEGISNQGKIFRAEQMLQVQ